MSIWRTINRHDTTEAQISRGQMFVVGAVLASYGREANLLVFGCGNDSPLWHDLNGLGRTLFVEDDPKWLERTRTRCPHLDAHPIDYGDATVAGSLPIDEDALRSRHVPEILRECRWDVILVDGPRGGSPERPGRSLSIFWAHEVADERTHVFVDDYQRELERAYADRFLRADRTYNVEVPRVLRRGKPSDSVMLWSLGSDGLGAAERDAGSDAPALVGSLKDRVEELDGELRLQVRKKHRAQAEVRELKARVEELEQLVGERERFHTP